jgi:hypothetical protein
MIAVVIEYLNYYLFWKDTRFTREVIFLQAKKSVGEKVSTAEECG